MLRRFPVVKADTRQARLRSIPLSEDPNIVVKGVTSCQVRVSVVEQSPKSSDVWDAGSNARDTRHACAGLHGGG